MSVMYSTHKHTYTTLTIFAPSPTPTTPTTLTTVTTLTTPT